ncbi:unnamed protein product [Rhizophagus irregularis]|nr:unnamed protein product [Rhizophagus irregularis]
MANRFVSSTKEMILEFQNASRNVNTDKSNNVWMSLFIKFREARGYSIEIIELDNKTLSDQGGDAKRLKASWIIEMDDGGIKLELPKEKNHAGGIKDPYAVSGTSFISPDTSESVYTPVADIKKYLTKRPNNVEGDYFFVSINTPKNINHGEWYLSTKLGKGSHDTMMRSICIDSGLDFKDRSITNHSMRSTGIHNLVESGVTLDEQMTFSRHKTIAGVSAYQHQSIKRKRDNASLLIPTKDVALKDSTNYANQLGLTKASNLIEQYSNTSYVEKNESDDDSKCQKPKIPKISVENCSNININITFKCD